MEAKIFRKNGSLEIKEVETLNELLAMLNPEEDRAEVKIGSYSLEIPSFFKDWKFGKTQADPVIVFLDCSPLILRKISELEESERSALFEMTGRIFNMIDREIPSSLKMLFIVLLSETLMRTFSAGVISSLKEDTLEFLLKKWEKDYEGFEKFEKEITESRK